MTKRIFVLMLVAWMLSGMAAVAAPEIRADLGSELTISWSAGEDAPASYTFRLYRGETLLIEKRLSGGATSYHIPGWYVREAGEYSMTLTSSGDGTTSRATLSVAAQEVKACDATDTKACDATDTKACDTAGSNASEAAADKACDTAGSNASEAAADKACDATDSNASEAAADKACDITGSNASEAAADKACDTAGSEACDTAGNSACDANSGSACDTAADNGACDTNSGKACGTTNDDVRGATNTATSCTQSASYTRNASCTQRVFCIRSGFCAQGKWCVSIGSCPQPGSSAKPTNCPVKPTMTAKPTAAPTAPVATAKPTAAPTAPVATAKPTAAPTAAPTAPVATAKPTAAPTSAPSGGNISSMASEVVRQVNAERANAGLSALSVDSDLTAAACIRAQEIVQSFSHTRPDGRSCFTVSSKAFGENIAKGQTSADRVMAAWMSSEGHRANILRESFGSIGVCAIQVNGTYYWVQLFGR